MSFTNGILTKRVYAAALAAAFALLCPAFVNAQTHEVKKAKYVFLFIGDGMSTAHRLVTDMYLKSQDLPGLTMQTFEVQGLTFTHSATSPITDSAAAGTAMATGQKTYSGAIGVDVDRKTLPNVSEFAKKSGKRVGIISNTSVNHATPGAFYAHQNNRGNYYKIGLDMLNSSFDYFAAGGFYDSKGGIMVDEKGRWLSDPDKTKPDLYDLLPSKGFTMVDTHEGFSALNKTSKLPVYVKNPRLAEEDTCFYALDRKPGDITIADYVAKGIELLDNPNGFFIMCEGGKIDWTAHANDPRGTVAEVKVMDEAITVAYEFAKKHPDETLIIVTGDHDTGALTMGFAGTGYNLYLSVLANQTMTSWQAAADFNAVKSAKAKAKEEFTLDEGMKFICERYGFKLEGDAKTDRMVLTDIEKAELKLAFERSVAKAVYAPNENARVLYGGYIPFIVTASRVLSNKAGVAWTTFDHSGMPVGTSAHGVSAYLFGNYTDNTDIAKNLFKVLGSD